MLLYGAYQRRVWSMHNTPANGSKINRLTKLREL